jgi:hypothetical protein
VVDDKEYIPYLLKAAREVLTAKLSSIGNSGGTTEVMMRTQSRSNLLFFKPRSTPVERKGKQ